MLICENCGQLCFDGITLVGKNGLTTLCTDCAAGMIAKELEGNNDQ